MSITACSALLRDGPGTPVGLSGRAGGYIVTVKATQHGRLPSLVHRPDDDRFRLSLVLISVDGKSRKEVPIASGLRASSYRNGTRIIGDDGQRVWFYTNELSAYDYVQNRIVSARELPRYTEPAEKHSFLSIRTQDYLDPADHFADRFKRPAFVLAGRREKPLRLSAPDSVLLTHRTNRGLFGTLAISRLTEDGRSLWTADSGMQDLDQIIPAEDTTALIGQLLPTAHDQFRPKILVLINNKSGAVSTHSF